MWQFRQRIIALSLCFLALNTLVITASEIQPSIAASVVDEQYAGSEPPSRSAGTIGAIYDPSREDAFGSSFLFAANAHPSPRASGKDAIICKSAKDEICAMQRDWMQYFAYLQECTESVLSDCVFGVTAIQPDGTEIKGVFQRRVPRVSATDFEGNPDRKIPNGRTPGLWKFPSIRHVGGEDFLVAVGLEGRSNIKNPANGWTQLKMSIFPVSSVTPVRGGGVMTIATIEDGTFITTGAFDRSHVYHSPTEALNRWPFPSDVRFRLKVRFSNPQLGWLHGRVFEPTARVEITDLGQEIEVEANPVSVPVLDPWTRWSELSDALREYYSARSPGGDFCKGWVEDKWEDLCINVGGGSSSNLETMRIFLEWVKIAQDMASAAKTTWSVRTMVGSELTEKSECYTGDKLLSGFVSTNSTVYIAGPPTFNAQTQTLDYKVASPHFDKNGGLNTGSYTLMMRSSTARCVYGFKDAPINASISVLSADGKEQVATTVVVEKDGWLNLSAKGFTYSSPTLRVALTQESENKKVLSDQSKVINSEASEPLINNKVAIPKTKQLKNIVCIKGKSIKKIKGVKPKCPSGYRIR